MSASVLPSEESHPPFWPLFWQGVREAVGMPALVLMATMVGVGGLARDVGYPLGAAMFSTLAIWAGPAQVVMFGSLAAGASLPAIAVAISLSSIRFLPMAVSLLPYIRRKGDPLWKVMFLVHFVAITAWVEGMRRLPGRPEGQRQPFYIGFSSFVMGAATLATGLGYVLIGTVPPAFAAGLLFLSPIYFTCSLAAGAKRMIDWLALGFGFALSPLVFHYAPPGMDLLAQGLVGGTLAYGIHRLRQAGRGAA